MHIRIVRWAAVAALASALLGGGAAHASRGGNPHSTPMMQRAHVTVLLGQVTTTSAGSFQLQPVYTMPLSVTVGVSTTITVASMPGTTADIQSGRFVNVAGMYDSTQQTFNASRVDVVVPTVSGQVTAVNGATFTMRSDRGETFQVTTTSSTQMVGLGAGLHRGRLRGHFPKLGPGGSGQQGQGGPAPQTTVAIGNEVMVQAFPPAAGSNALTALRMMVGNQTADSNQETTAPTD